MSLLSQVSAVLYYSYHKSKYGHLLNEDGVCPMDAPVNPIALIFVYK